MQIRTLPRETYAPIGIQPMPPAMTCADALWNPRLFCRPRKLFIRKDKYYSICLQFRELLRIFEQIFPIQKAIYRRRALNQRARVCLAYKKDLILRACLLQKTCKRERKHHIAQVVRSADDNFHTQKYGRYIEKQKRLACASRPFFITRNYIIPNIPQASCS